MQKRRDFLKNAAWATGAVTFTGCQTGSPSAGQPAATTPDFTDIDAALSRPVLKKALFPEPVILDSVELLHYRGNFLCRVRDKQGAEGICVSNNYQMRHLYPIFLNRIQGFFVGKDVRDWERLLDEVYVHQSNYKLQSLALWVPLATLEFAVFDLLGKLVWLPMGALLGEIHHTEIAVYQANNFRGETAEVSIEKIAEQVAENGAKALKFKVGGRMSHNADYPPGRTEALIPLIRKRFGQEMTVYADANGSYTAEEAIRIGKMMEHEGFDFFEEPVPFDWYEQTKEVTKALNVPIAGGEQEPSMRNFRWLIAHDALDIVQPDIFYFGGMVRSMKVARMAAAKGKVCTPHISGSGLGYLYMMHFVSATPNAGPFHEFKGFNEELPLESPTSDLQSDGGKVKVPTAPGLGVTIDPDYVAKHEVVKGI